jgi:hypothetical protein
MMASMQNSLLPLAPETPPSAQTQKDPVFGVQASWICYGHGKEIINRLIENMLVGQTPP